MKIETVLRSERGVLCHAFTSEQLKTKGILELYLDESLKP
jgi:hypothetical protein